MFRCSKMSNHATSDYIDSASVVPVSSQTDVAGKLCRQCDASIVNTHVKWRQTGVLVIFSDTFNIGVNPTTYEIQLVCLQV